jgi:hypothetical protein
VIGWFAETPSPRRRAGARRHAATGARGPGGRRERTGIRSSAEAHSPRRRAGGAGGARRHAAAARGPGARRERTVIGWFAEARSPAAMPGAQAGPGATNPRALVARAPAGSPA